MEKLEEILESWKDFVLSDILKRLDKELETDIEVLMDSLREKGILKDEILF